MGDMARVRPSVRLVALLVYALVVNAVVWATVATAKSTLSSRLICHTAADQGAAPAGPAQLAPHDCCDLACAAVSAIVPPRIIATLALTGVATVPPNRVSALTLTPDRDRPWPTGPPGN
jgi:hypothetical protein